MVLLVWVYCKGQFLYFFRGQFLGDKKSGLIGHFLLYCIFKTTYMCLLMVNRFFESILTCVPICLFSRARSFAASPVLLGYSSGDHLTTPSFDVICFANVQVS